MNISFIAAGLLLAAALYTDMRWMAIPNRLTVPFFLSGCIYQFLIDGWSGGIYALGGAAAGFIPLLALHLARGIGAGDVKLFGAVGVWVGAASTMQLMLYAILYAGLFGLILLMINRPFAQRMIIGISSLFLHRPGDGKEEGKFWGPTANVTSFPFMLAVAPGAMTAWVFAG